MRRTLTVRLSVRPVIVYIRTSVTCFRQPRGRAVSFVLFTCQGRIQYGDLSRTSLLLTVILGPSLDSTYFGSSVESLLVARFHLERLFTAVHRIEVLVELEVACGHVEIGGQHQIVSLPLFLADQHVLLLEIVHNAREMPRRELVFALLHKALQLQSTAVKRSLSMLKVSK